MSASVEDVDVFADQKKSRRDRLWAAVDFICREGAIQRSHMMLVGEVSVAQASLDFRLIMERLPGLMTYNRRAKEYELGL